MTLINVERIKLFSTRSPYWCLALILLVGVGITLLITLTADGPAVSLADSRRWVGFAISVVMVMAALSITTEYRFGTIRNSFLGSPTRLGVLVSKAVLVALLSFVVVAVTSALTFVLARTLSSSSSGFRIQTAADWRGLWGPAVVAALAAVLGVGVGTLVRQSAAAIAILILWPTVIENLFLLFGDWGRKAYPWLPFQASTQLYSADDPVNRILTFGATVPTWWQGLLLFTGVCVVIFGAALAVVKRRDA